jgi:GNAT superfamily N-acetyltransferase
MSDVEAVTRIAVEVTFLEMKARPVRTLPLPEGWRVEHVTTPDTALYRWLYAGVGHDYCWWLRRVMPDAALHDLLADPQIALHVLRRDETTEGFFELDSRTPGIVNLAYFGLMPSAIGHGVGRAFLSEAVQAAWGSGPERVRVNTCTADHPRALGVYLNAGFHRVRTAREVWDIPDELGLPIPDYLRV